MADALLRFLDVLGFQDPIRDLGQQRLAVPLADQVADRVANDGARHCGDQHRRQRQLVLVGQHSAEDDPDLTGQHHTDERGGLQSRQQEDQQERQQRRQVEDSLQQMTHALLLPKPARRHARD